MSNQIMRKFDVAEEIDDIIEYKQIKIWCNEYTPIEEIIDDLLRNTTYQDVEPVVEHRCYVCGKYREEKDMIEVPFLCCDTDSNHICLKCKCLQQDTVIAQIKGFLGSM